LINPDLLDAHQRRVRDTYLRAVSTYLPGPYSGRIVVLWPREDTPPVADSTLGWGHLAHDVALHLIPGSHLTCMGQYGDKLAQQLRICLDTIR
jgi:hypothetical protein